MTNEISNKTLAILLVGAIFVSLIGTFISLNRLNQIGPMGLRGITGMQTAQGRVNLSVSGMASFTTNTNVDFGIITPNVTAYWISTNTDNIWAGGQANNCSDADGPCQGIEIQNDGNEILNITFNTTTNAASLIGGTGPSFMFNVRNGNRSGYGNENGCNGTLNYNVTGMWYEISAGTDYVLCNGTKGAGLGFASGADKMTMEFNLTIPGDAPQSTDAVAVINLWNLP